AKAEGELFFQWSGNFDAFGFPPSAFPAALMELVADALAVHATALELGQREDWEELFFHFTVGAVVEFESNSVPDDLANLFPDIHDEEIGRAANIDAHVEGATRIVGAVTNEFGNGHEFEVGIGAGVEHFVSEKRGIFIGW